MSIALTITPAEASARADALDLVFQHLPAEERRQRCANAIAMFLGGEVPAQSLLVARHADKLLGALVCIPLPGASALFWPPQVAPGLEPALVADPLVRHALDQVGKGGAKIAQAIIASADLPLAEPLVRCGFRHVTKVQFLRHAGPTCPPRKPSLELAFEAYQSSNERLFHATLERTYAGTLDIPELNGRRSIEEIIAGHRNQGRFRPEHWCLALHQQRPVGVMMLAEPVDGQAWEMAYLGVVPQERGHGVGWALAQRGLNQAFAAGARQLMVAVDVRNGPAHQLYEKMGFVPHDEREVLLFFFADLAAAAPATSRKLNQTNR